MAEFAGNAAQDPNRGEGQGTVWDKYPMGRAHPRLPDRGDFKDWMIITPNSMVDAFQMETTIEDTVTPPNPTPPTNISYWGETPPTSPEHMAAVEPVTAYSKEQEESQQNQEIERSEADEERRSRAYVEDAGEPQDPTKFAPSLGGNSPEAAGTEEVVETLTYDVSGDETTVEVPVAVTAGVIGYTRAPNATHPSNEDPQPVEPQNGSGGGTTPEPETPIDLTSITPETAVAGSGTFVLTVTGTGFPPDSVILFKDTPVATTFVSETELRADAVPVSATPETVDVEVQSGDNLSDVLTFDFTAAGREGEEQPRRKSERKPSKKQKSAKGKTSKTSKKGRR